MIRPAGTPVQPREGRTAVAVAGLVAVGAGLLSLALVPLRVEAQGLLAALLVGAFLLLRRMFAAFSHPARDVLRLALLAMGAFASLRYLGWRAAYTLSADDLASMLASLALFAAEVYAISMYFLGIFVNLQPLERGDLAPRGPRGEWPTVDVLIPTYDEPVEVVETTLIAATQLDYPADRVRVHLLDDGGTAAKLADPDPVRAAAARSRAARLEALCAELGARYLTREDNAHAKAGNVNAALRRTGGELLLMLDCDHVPAADILLRTVGHFERDPRLFLVQTPHFFVTPDPVERNLRVFGRMPGESEVFYDQIQLGLDFWESSFFCGSAAVLRREPLVQAGGLSTLTVTEDAETSLALHARGFRSVYVNRPMVAGLQPPSFDAFVRQRARWAQGMTQIFLLNNPLTQPGLSAVQRAGYLNSTLFWLFGFARLVFLLAPAAYLILGLKIFHATAFEILVYAVPHVVLGYMVDDLLFGNVRWLFFSQLYEVLLAPFNWRALLRVFADPRAPVFLVTPKSELSETDYISRLVRPFYAMYGVAIAALAFGAWRWHAIPGDRETTAITLAWMAFSVLYLHAALGALLERRQRRRDPRMPARRRGVLHARGEALEGWVTDLSLGGALFVPDAPHAPSPERGRLEIRQPGTDQRDDFAVEVRRASAAGAARSLGLAFAPASLHERRRIVAQVYGSSERWERLRHHRTGPIGISRPLVNLVLIGSRYMLAHAAQALRRPPAAVAAPVSSDSR